MFVNEENDRKINVSTSFINSKYFYIISLFCVESRTVCLLVNKCATNSQ